MDYYTALVVTETRNQGDRNCFLNGIWLEDTSHSSQVQHFIMKIYLPSMYYCICLLILKICTEYIE